VLAAALAAAASAACAVQGSTAGTVTFGVRPEADGSNRLVRIDGASVTTIGDWRLDGTPDVSFDGQHVLVAASGPADRAVAIRELSADGGGDRVVLPCPRGCSTPRYLPNGRIVFAARTGSGSIEALFVSVPGAPPERITFGNARDRVVSVLDDGRVRFDRVGVDGRGPDAGGPRGLIVAPDGSGVITADEVPLRAPAATAPRVAGAVSGPRPAPPITTSMMDHAKHTGWLLCLDAWLGQQDGRAIRHEGQSVRVRVTDGESGRVLGDAPIEADGSFYIEVPADRLLRLSTLDQAGRVVASLDSGVWVRPNEHRGCIGCHEPASLAPRNAQPLAVRNAPVPVLGHAPAHAEATHD
jgi:hypothetical protein